MCCLTSKDEAVLQYKHVLMMVKLRGATGCVSSLNQKQA